MRVTQAAVRGIYATALQYLDDDQAPAEPRHLMRALDTAIHRRHPEADARTKRQLRHRALEGLPGWQRAGTRADLARQLRQAARRGLDLTELVGEPYARAAGRIWSHGAYSSRRVRRDRPVPRGLSYSGRPWVRVWTDDDEASNPAVLHAEFGT
ncbi:hypothetical protein [Streptomyces sp. enrichment culture]|uniref:hypothetical protein n=1 Tax=Streptomyces sp. enrichment culture TaxID=1795815 RepID=UPI003F57701D